VGAAEALRDAALVAWVCEGLLALQEALASSVECVIHDGGVGAQRDAGPVDRFSEEGGWTLGETEPAAC
jgi:hypothetical protein